MSTKLRTLKSERRAISFYLSQPLPQASITRHGGINHLGQQLLHWWGKRVEHASNILDFMCIVWEVGFYLASYGVLVKLAYFWCQGTVKNKGKRGRHPAVAGTALWNYKNVQNLKLLRWDKWRRMRNAPNSLAFHYAAWGAGICFTSPRALMEPT